MADEPADSHYFVDKGISLVCCSSSGLQILAPRPLKETEVVEAAASGDCSPWGVARARADRAAPEGAIIAATVGTGFSIGTGSRRHLETGLFFETFDHPRVRCFVSLHVAQHRLFVDERSYGSVCFDQPPYRSPETPRRQQDGTDGAKIFADGPDLFPVAVRALKVSVLPASDSADDDISHAAKFTAEHVAQQSDHLVTCCHFGGIIDEDMPRSRTPASNFIRPR